MKTETTTTARVSTEDKIQDYMARTVCHSEDSAKTCRIHDTKWSEDVLTIKFNTTPTQSELEETVKHIVNENMLPYFLIKSIIKQVESCVVFTMTA